MTGRLTICLHSGSTLLDRAIKWQTRGRWSHVSAILPDGTQVEARPFHGVVKHPVFTPDPGETVQFFTVPMTPDQEIVVARFLLDQVGCGYDWRAVLAFVTRCKLTKASATRWFCSELVFSALQRGGLELLRTTQPVEVDPVLFGRSTLLEKE